MPLLFIDSILIFFVVLLAANVQGWPGYVYATWGMAAYLVLPAVLRRLRRREPAPAAKRGAGVLPALAFAGATWFEWSTIATQAQGTWTWTVVQWVLYGYAALFGGGVLVALVLGSAYIFKQVFPNSAYTKAVDAVGAQTLKPTENALEAWAGKVETAVARKGRKPAPAPSDTPKRP